MPQVFLTKADKRSHTVKKIINDYSFEGGISKKQLANEIGIPVRTFYDRLKHPDKFSLCQLWKLCDKLNISEEDRGKMLN